MKYIWIIIQFMTIKRHKGSIGIDFLNYFGLGISWQLHVWLSSSLVLVNQVNMAADIQSNPDKVLASVLCQSEDFIRTRTLSGLTFLRPYMCGKGLCNANAVKKGFVMQMQSIMYTFWLGYLNFGTPKKSAYNFQTDIRYNTVYQKK